MEQRLKQIIEYYGFNPYSLEQKIFVSEGTISKFLAGKIGMKVGTLVKILELFPDISPDWLLLGKGEMLRQKDPAPAPSIAPNDFLLQLLAEKDNRIEALVRENERLRQQLESERKKSASMSALIQSS